MEYSPPPLFKQGPSAFARLVFFVLLSFALLVADARFKTLETVRTVIGAALFPLQRVALVPRDLFVSAANVAISSTQLRADNTRLRAQNLQLSVAAGQNAALAAENAHLRALLQLSQRIATQTTPAEIQYDTRDPFTQKVVIGRGSQQGVQNGSPVVSEDGVVGQVTRVFPLQAEVTLITDRDQAVPVEVVRTGLRSVIYGTPKGDLLDLRFVPVSADVVAGDELVTSGLDGVYPPGLPVAKVLHVDKVADTAFARIVCAPLAAVRGARQMLVLHYDAHLPPRPDTDDDATADGAKSKKPAKAGSAKGDKTGKPADASAVAAASGAKAAPAAAAKAAPAASDAKEAKPDARTAKRAGGASAPESARRRAARALAASGDAAGRGAGQ